MDVSVSLLFRALSIFFVKILKLRILIWVLSSLLRGWSGGEYNVNFNYRWCPWFSMCFTSWLPLGTLAVYHFMTALPSSPHPHPFLSGVDNGIDRFLHFGLSSEFWKKKTMFKCNLNVAKDIEWLWHFTDIVVILNRLEVKLYIWNCDFRSCITLTCCSFYLVCQYWTEGNMIITLHKGAWILD